MLLNRAKVEELFNQEAILIGNSDGVPYFRAVALFGEKAAAWAKGTDFSGWNQFGLGNDKPQLAYLNKKGFYQAATWANVENAVIIEAGGNENVEEKT